MPGKAYIGTSGWNYKTWREDFYGDTQRNRWLRFCSQRFTGIEVNGTFIDPRRKTRSKNGAIRHLKHFALL